MSKTPYYLDLRKYQKTLAKHEYIYKNETSRNTRKNTDSNFWLLSSFLSPSKIIIFTAFRNIFSFFEYKNFTFLQILQPPNHSIQRNTKKTYSLKCSYSKTRYFNNQYQNHLLKPNALINYAIQRYFNDCSTKSDVNPKIEHFRLNKDKYPVLCKYCKRIAKTRKPKTFFGWVYSLIRGGPKESTSLKDLTKCCTSTCKDDVKSKIPQVKEPHVEEKKKSNVKKMSQLAPCVTDNVDIKQSESNTEGAKTSESKVEVTENETSHSGSNIHDKLNELCKKYDLEDVWLSDKVDNSCDKHKILQCSGKQTENRCDDKLSKMFEICKPEHKEEHKLKCKTEIKNKTDDNKINKKKSFEEIINKGKTKDSKPCVENIKALTSSICKDIPCSEQESKKSNHSKEKPCIEKLSKSCKKKKACTPIISYNVDITSYISKATGKICDNKTKKNVCDKEYQLSVVLSECPKEGKKGKDICKKDNEKDKKCQPICSNQSQKSSAKKVSSLENLADKHSLDNFNHIATKVQEVQNKMSVASILNSQDIKEPVELLPNNCNNADEVKNKNANENETLILKSQSDKTENLSVIKLPEEHDKDVTGNLLLHSQSKDSDGKLIEFFRLAEEQKKYDSTNENISILREDQSNELCRSSKVINGKEKDDNDFKVNENLKPLVADDQLKDLKKSPEIVGAQQKFGDEIKNLDILKQLNDLDKLSKLIDELTKRNNQNVNGYETLGTNVNQNETIELSDVTEEVQITDNREEKCNEKNVNVAKPSLYIDEQTEVKKLYKKIDCQKEESLVNSKSKQSDDQALKQNNVEPPQTVREQTFCMSEKIDGNNQQKLLEQIPWGALFPEENKSNLPKSYRNINNSAMTKITESHPFQLLKENFLLKKSRSVTHNTKKKAGVKLKTISKTKSTISSKKFRDNNLQKQQKVMVKSSTDIYSDMTALLPRNLKNRHQKMQSKKTNECQRQKNYDNSEVMNDITKIVKFGKVLNEARDPNCYAPSENFNKPKREQCMKHDFGDDSNSANGVLMECSKKLQMASQEIENSCSQHPMKQPKLYHPSENSNKPICEKKIKYDASSIQGMFVKGIGINKFKKSSQENCKIKNTFEPRTAEHQPKQSSREIAEMRLLSHKTQEFCKVMLELVQLFSEYKASSELLHCDRSIENLRRKQMKIKELHNTVKSLEENLIEFLEISGNEGVGSPTGPSYNDKYKYFSYEGCEKTSAFDRRKKNVNTLPNSLFGQCNEGVRQYKTLSKTKIPARNFNFNIKVDKLNSANAPLNKEEFRKTLIDLIFLFTSPDEIFNKSNVVSKNRGFKRKERL